MRKDDSAMDKICLTEWKEPDEKAREWLLENIEYKKNEHPSLYNKIMYLKHPRWLYWKVYSKLFCEYSPVDVDDSFLKLCFKM